MNVPSSTDVIAYSIGTRALLMDRFPSLQLDCHRCNSFVFAPNLLPSLQLAFNRFNPIVIAVIRLPSLQVSCNGTESLAIAAPRLPSLRLAFVWPLMQYRSQALASVALIQHCDTYALRLLLRTAGNCVLL